MPNFRWSPLVANARVSPAYLPKLAMLRLHFTCILLLAASTPAQTVDGEYPILQQWDGGSSDYHGWCVACAGDVSADGFSHRVLASRSGVGPIHYGVDIPLGYDPLLLRSSYCK